MSPINTAIRFDPAAKPNPRLENLTRAFAKKDNAVFLAEVVRRLGRLEPEGPAGTSLDPGGVAAIGLIGTYGLLGYRLRRAQEVVRLDRGPSYWSHAFLIASPLGAKKGTWAWECTLEPAGEFNLFADRTGVSPRRLRDYATAGFDLTQPHCVPNIAVIVLDLTAEERGRILDWADNPDIDQLRYDLGGLLGQWYAYLADPATRTNPLAEGAAIPSAAYVQLAYDAAGIDLGLGTHQRNVTPEHIWQSAKVLHAWCEVAEGKTGERKPRRIVGWYCTRDKACVAAPPDATVPMRLSQMMGIAEGRRAR